MSVDTTFRPFTATYAVDNTAAVQIKEAQSVGVVTFRIRAITASGYIAWGFSSGVSAPTAPVIGTPKANTIGINLGQAIYLDLPSTTFFIGSAAIGTGSFEITGGQGGTGG